MYVICNPVDPLADLRDQALKDDALSNRKVHKIVSVISPKDRKSGHSSLITVALF